jgi:hypothetical protein
MKAAAATTVAVAAKEVAASEGLLRFPMKAYAPRAAVPLPPREPALPQSIKDAIVRWLDEQL